jgi:hypothetical protein
MAEDGTGSGSGDEGTGETGEPPPDIPEESQCHAESLSVVFDVTVDEGPESLGDAIAFEGEEILVGAVANGGPALTKLSSDGELLWTRVWPEFEAEVVRIDLDESGASAVFAGLPDGNLTAAFDTQGQLAFERMVPETGYDFHPSGVDVYYENTGAPFEPGPEELEVRRAAWRTYLDESAVGVLDNYFSTGGGADLWDLIISESAPVHVEEMLVAQLLDGSGNGEEPFPDRVLVGSVGAAPWIASYAVDEGKNFSVIIEAGAPASFTAIAVGPDRTAVAGGFCQANAERWGWLARTDGSGQGLDDATNACQTWSALGLPPVADLAVTDDETIVVVTDDSDALALVQSGQTPELLSLSDLLGHAVTPRAVAAAGTCDFVVTGRVESDGRSFVARVAGE